MIDIAKETIVSLVEAAQARNIRRHVSTLHRWHAHGIRGVRLETILIGGRRATSLEALARFIASTTERVDGTPSTGNAAIQDEVDRQLDELGF